MKTISKCDLCETPLVLEDAAGNRVEFMAHTPAFCADGIRLLLSTYRRVVADNAKYSAEREMSLRLNVDCLEQERDAYRAMVCDLLASASPHPTEHPTMTRQWERARKLLKDGPPVDQRKAERDASAAVQALIDARAISFDVDALDAKGQVHDGR